MHTLYSHERLLSENRTRLLSNGLQFWSVLLRKHFASKCRCVFVRTDDDADVPEPLYIDATSLSQYSNVQINNSCGHASPQVQNGMPFLRISLSGLVVVVDVVVVVVIGPSDIRGIAPVSFQLYMLCIGIVAETAAHPENSPYA